LVNGKPKAEQEGFQVKAAFYSETPLILNPRLARAFGVTAAIILQQIHYWQEKSKELHNGKAWVYNTIDAWMQQIPIYKNPETLRKAFKKLETDGMIETGNFNTNKYDRTKWYTINYETVQRMLNDQEGGLDDNNESGSIPTKSGNGTIPKVGIESDQKLESLIQRLPETTTKTTKYVRKDAPIGLYNTIKDTIDTRYTKITGERLPWKTKGSIYGKQIKQIIGLCSGDEELFLDKANALQEKLTNDQWYKSQPYTYATIIAHWEKLRVKKTKDPAIGSLEWYKTKYKESRWYT